MSDPWVELLLRVIVFAGGGFVVGYLWSRSKP